MRNKELNKLKNIISKLPIKNRLILLESIGKSRYNIFYPENIEIKPLRHEAFNYELEFIALLSVTVDNKVKYSSIPTDKSWIIESARIIGQQDYLISLFESYGALGAMAGLFFMQMQGQKNYSNLYYRYNFMYNFVNENVNMPQIFKNHFHVDFESFLDFCMLISTYKEFKNAKNLDWFYSKLNDDLKIVMDTLTKKRTDFRSLFDEISGNDETFSFFDLNLLLQFPFVEYHDNVFCPWFPFIPYASTESLMFHLTKGNNDLRSLIGKNVLESYVYHLLDSAKFSFDLVKHREIIYGKEHKHTSDIVLVKNEKVLLLEIKFLNQSLSLRELDEFAIDYYSHRLATGFVQLKKNIELFKTGFFDLKIGSQCTVAKGVLLSYDECYIHREEIYSKACEILIQDGVDTSIDILKNEIILMSLYNFENILANIDDDFIDYTFKLFEIPTTWLDMQYHYDDYNKDIDGLPEVKKFLDAMLDKFANKIEHLIDLE